MPRTADLGVTKWVWIPGVAGIADPNAPTVAEVTAVAAKDISSYVVTTTDIQVQASDTVNERAVTDVTNAVIPTVGNYGGTLDTFRDFTTGAPSANDPLTVIGATVGVVGWLVKRVGKASALPLIATDKVSCFLVMIDNPQTTGGQGDGFLKAKFPILQQGRFSIEKAVVS
ncbi:phage tail tube protein [Cellulomonas rhizosphaerae]|uniref:Phage tail protein n=1 Tax=Cellulomonas rhizosphaerae TaxID=2293719 RepID=A0A413RJI4_9CELL|nr:hypothetical protein [Cellulomonas rhizosphaerae]RHA38740.1 hypothetical protein D1825_13485 [Cellulomonas rhizosphaerae]